MILIIDDTLRFNDATDMSATEQDEDDTAEQFEKIEKICRDFNIHYMLDLREDGVTFVVYPQKIVLSEQNMNTLFFEVFFLFNYDTAYASIGGTGCEFAMRVCTHQPD